MKKGLFIGLVLLLATAATAVFAATFNLSGGTPTALFTQAGALSGHGDFVTLTIPFTVTASSGNIYIPSTAVLATATSSNPTKIEYCVTRQGVCRPANTIGIYSEVNYAGTGALSSLPTVTQNGNYVVPSGKTLPFTLVVYVASDTAGINNPMGLYRAKLLTIPYASSDVTTGYTSFSGSGLSSNTFRTPLIGL